MSYFGHDVLPAFVGAEGVHTSEEEEVEAVILPAPVFTLLLHKLDTHLMHTKSSKAVKA